MYNKLVAAMTSVALMSAPTMLTAQSTPSIPSNAAAPQVPSQTQPPAAALENGAGVVSSIPEGRDIPAAEAEQLRGGRVKIALVIVRAGGRQVMRLITCSSDSACRREAIQRFGQFAIETIITGVAYDVVKRAACRRGVLIAC